MGINSRSKGNKNERNAAGLITKWTNKKFERTPSSGGLQWKTSFSKGDIVCVVEGHKFNFCVEVKAHKEIDFSHLLNPKVKNVKILDFWDQCERDATACSKVPLLMMRYDRLPKDLFFIGIPLKFYHYLQTHKYFLSTSLLFQTEDYGIAFLPSTEFFNLPYKEIKQLTKTYLKP